VTVLTWVPLLLLNVCVCIDLIFLVRRPFKSHEKRLPYYIVGTLLMSSITLYFAIEAYNTTQVSQKINFYKLLVDFVLAEYLGVVFFAIVSVSIAAYRLY
jgi:hypothetical protein